MKLLRTHAPRAAQERRGAALLLSFLVLIVILTIAYQINKVTATDVLIARNDVTITKMDLAAESAFLQVHQMLQEDAEAAMGGGEDPMAGEGGSPGGESAPAPDGDPAAGGGASEAVDSKMDEWGRPQSTTINEINLRILIQDEDSKYNVLNMLNEDEEQAQLAFDRVVRILEACRDGTTEVIDSSVADEMARVMLDHMRERTASFLPRPTLLTDDEENEELGLPLSLREFVALEPFQELHFRDYFDEDGLRVHSIESFLTVWTSPYSEGDDGEGAAEGGFAVNVNTAPVAVLSSLMDSRDVEDRFWEGVLEYRNLEEEPEDDEEEVDPILDEYGNELIRRQFFDNLEEMNEVYGWDVMEEEIKSQVEELLTVESHVFSIFVTARVSTVDESRQVEQFTSRQEQEEYERSGTQLVRTIRSVCWRNTSGEEAVIVPLLRWEVLDYAPLEVLDYPDEQY